MAINKLMGNAVKTDIEKTEKKLKDILIADETIDLSFKLVRDRLVITNKRIILIDYQGTTGKKVEYLSIPYRSIVYFAVETAGHIDLDFELKLWLTGRSDPITRKLKRSKDIAYQVINLLTSYITN